MLARMTDAVETFRALHVPGKPLLMPNPFDIGSAKALAHLGYQALATTSSAFANTLGRNDGGVTRDEAIAHGADLADTIRRLQAYQEAGADVLFAPRVIDPAELRTLVAEVDRPVSVLVLPSAPTVGELAELGVARVSVGGGFGMVAYGALVDAAR